MRHFLPLVLVLATACGGKIAPSTDDTGGISDPGPPSGVTSSPEPLPPPASGPLPGSSPPPKPSTAGYTVHAWGGGLDHVEIFKVDSVANTCVHLELASPERTTTNGAFAELYTPDKWAVLSGERTNDASSCRALAARPAGAPAIGSRGFITLDSFGTNGLPCRVNIHAIVNFQNVKVAERLDADGLSVDGCI